MSLRCYRKKFHIPAGKVKPHKLLLLLAALRVAKATGDRRMCILYLPLTDSLQNY